MPQSTLPQSRRYDRLKAGNIYACRWSLFSPCNYQQTVYLLTDCFSQADIHWVTGQEFQEGLRGKKQRYNSVEHIQQQLFRKFNSKSL